MVSDNGPTNSRSATIAAIVLSIIALGVVLLIVMAPTRETGDRIAITLIEEARANDGMVSLRSPDVRYCILGEENLVHVGRSFEGSTVRWLESRETDGVWFLFRQRAEDPGAADIFTIYQDALQWDAYGPGPARARFCPEELRIETVDGRETIVWFSATESPRLAPAEE